MVVEVAGRLIMEAPIQSLTDLTNFMTDRRGRLLLLDLGEVSQIDCSGIGQLVKLFVKVRRLGGRFALLNIQRRPRRLLHMSGLLAVFPVLDCVQTAVSRTQNYDVA